MKKRIEIIIGSCICVILIFSAGYYFANRNNNKDISNKNVTTKADIKQVVSQQKPKQEDNKIEGLDLGVLTKDQFHQAIEKGKEYKNKSVDVKDVNMIVWSNEQFQQNLGKGFIIISPYVAIIDEAKGVAEQYLEVNDKNVVNKIKKDKRNCNIFRCVASVGGDDINFVQDLKIVLRVYGKNETKVLQPQNTEKESNGAKPTKFFPNSPVYSDGIEGDFNAADVVKLEPQKLEIIVVYPNGKEVKQIFDYNKLNQL